jgi:glycosyltransferase involved in cell wall biosynthesis
VIRRAVVVAPARLGQGGLGEAAAQAVMGWTDLGVQVDFAGRDRSEPNVSQRLASIRGVRRASLLAREADRMSVKVHGSYDALYAMPGFVGHGGWRGPSVLHQATQHPMTVIEAVAEARSRAGGGRGFMTSWEAQRIKGEIARATAIRVESRYVRDDLVSRGVDDRKIVYAPPGVDLDRFEPGRGSKDLDVCYVGTLSLWKGLEQLCKLQRQLPRPIAVVGGPVCGWSSAAVRTAGFRRFPEKVVEVMQRSRFLVLPSVSDGFGYVALEAMACGAIPIVTSASGCAEVVELLDPRLVVEARSFAEQAGQVLREVSPENLAIRARSIAERYDRGQQARVAMEAVTDMLMRNV